MSINPKSPTEPEQKAGHYECSHDECHERLPNSHQHQEIPPGWTVARVEEHGSRTINFYYVYLCPKHMITSTERQTDLFT